MRSVKMKLSMVLMLSAMLSPSFLMLSPPVFAQEQGVEQTQEVAPAENTVVSEPAVAAEEPIVVPPPTQSEWSAFLEGLGGIKGASTLAIVALVVQGLMLALKSGLGSLTGKLQLVLVYGLTLVGGVVALKVQGMDWGSILIHSSTMSAVQVFLHQIYKQFLVKET